MCPHQPSLENAGSFASSIASLPQSGATMLSGWPQKAGESSGQKRQQRARGFATALLNFAPIERGDGETKSQSTRDHAKRALFGGQSVPKKGTGLWDNGKAGENAQDSPSRQTCCFEILPTNHTKNACFSPLAKAIPKRRAPLTSKPQVNNSHQATDNTMSNLQKGDHGHSSHHEGRPRSRAIAIPRRARNTKVEEEIREMESAMHEYDWATWRLYNRLIQHRQRKQSFALDDTCVGSADQEGSTSYTGSTDLEVSTPPLGSRLEQSVKAPPLSPIHDEYGGIFELEL